MPNLLNFKDWKIESSDGKKATLKHANGHTMTLALKALPRLQREQVSRLAKGGTVQKLDEGTPETVQSDDASTSPGQPDHSTTININAAPAPAAPVNPVSTLANTPIQPQIPKVAAPVPNVDPSTGQLNPAAAAVNTENAAKGQAAIDAAKAKATVPIEQNYIQTAADLNKQFQDRYNALNDQVNKFAGDVQTVNPNRLIDNMSAPKKTQVGLGLILGGAGAGMLGSTDNPALRFLNAQIDRDVQAQNQNNTNKRTILGAYESLYGKGIEATNSAKAAMLDIYAHMGNQLTNQLGTPQAAVNNAKLSSDLGTEKIRLLRDAATPIQSLPGTKPLGGASPASGAGSGGGSGAVTPMTSATPAGGAGGMTTADLNNLHNQQTGPQSAGVPSSPASGEPEVKPLGGGSQNNTQLLPNAGEKLKSLQKFDIFARDPSRANALQTQYDQQVKADEQLAQVDNVYDKLTSERNGLWGRMHRGINPHTIAAGTGAVGTGVGAALGAPAGGIGAVPGAIAGGTIGTGFGEGLGHGLQALTNTGKNQEYDRDFETLKGIISASLPGRTTEFVEEAAAKYAPTSQDSEKEIIAKREAFKKFIVDHAPNGMLKQYGLLKSK